MIAGLGLAAAEPPCAGSKVAKPMAAVVAKVRDFFMGVGR